MYCDNMIMSDRLGGADSRVRSLSLSCSLQVYLRVLPLLGYIVTLCI